MKKKYEKPQVEVLVLCIQNAILLSASGSSTTDEALGRSFDDFDEDDYDEDDVY
jgi:hypothetical protein